MFFIRAFGLIEPGRLYLPGSGFLISGTWKRSVFDLKDTLEGSNYLNAGSITPNLIGLYSPGPGFDYPLSNPSPAFLPVVIKLADPAI